MSVIAAAIIQRTRRIKIGVLGNLPAVHGHPIRLAEEIAMLDVMSGGRIISGFVRGVPQEYLAMSVPLSEARASSLTDRNGIGESQERQDGFGFRKCIDTRYREAQPHRPRPEQPVTR